MLSAPSFKDVLARYQSRASTDRECLARWVDDVRANETWQAIQAKMLPGSAATAAEFIKAVLKARRQARGAIASVTFHDSALAHWRKYYQDATTQLWKKPLPLSDLAAALEDVAAGLRTTDECLSPLRPDVELSRKDQNGSRVRKLFMDDIGLYLHARCDCWLDAEVATLTEIAFPGPEMTVDRVRTIRRPTTRAGRSTRH